MMDKNRIKAEIDKYVNEFELGLVLTEPPVSQTQKESLLLTMRNSLEFGMLRGMEMVVRGLWHDAGEEPEKKPVLAEYVIDGVKRYTFSSCGFPDWENYRRKWNFSRYLYVEDLLPEGGEK